MPQTVNESNWRRMSDLEHRAILALSAIRFPVASPPKRLARSLAMQASGDKHLITDRQAEAMWKILYRFRRQIADQLLVDESL